MIARDEILARSAAGDDRYPLLTIDEFFDGNDDEQSIAPNQYGYGRPDLAEIAGRLETLAADPAVTWVRIQPHEEMFEPDYTGIAAESVAICSSMSNEDIDARLDVQSLMAEGVFEGFSYAEENYCEVPEIPPNYSIFTLTWSLTRPPRHDAPAQARV